MYAAGAREHRGFLRCALATQSYAIETQVDNATLQELQRMLLASSRPAMMQATAESEINKLWHYLYEDQ